MDLVGVHFDTQRGIDPLMALDGALALEFGRHDQGRPVTAISIDFEVLAGQAGGNQGAQLFGGHFNFSDNFEREHKHQGQRGTGFAGPLVAPP
jgi:hypothetical protein